MDGFAGWLAQLRWDSLLDTLIVALAAVLCISLHETCHGLAALALGDPTAKKMGRLSLNPLKHVDLVGLFLLIVAKVGWAKPVPVDARRFQDPRVGMASMFYSIYWDAAALELLADFFSYVFFISAGLAVFNLLPVPPLDGSKVLFAFIPREWYWKLMRYERYGMFLLMALLLTGALDVPLNFLRGGLTDLLMPISDGVYDLLYALHFG